MDNEFRRIVLERDEEALERAYFVNECPHCFLVDHGEDDDATVQYAAEALQLDSLTAEWRDDEMFIIYNGREVKVPLLIDPADRHITITTLNDLLNPKYELRFLVVSHGSDTIGLIALPVEEWRVLEAAAPQSIAENFIDPRKLPNLMTELTDEKLPAPARLRFERMLERIKAGKYS